MEVSIQNYTESVVKETVLLKTIPLAQRIAGEYGDIDYFGKILGNIQLKREIVHADPELAQRIFYVFGDKDIGRLFVSAYKNNRDYHHSVYFVAYEIRAPFERRMPVDEDYRPHSKDSLNKVLDFVD